MGKVLRSGTAEKRNTTGTRAPVVLSIYGDSPSRERDPIRIRPRDGRAPTYDLEVELHAEFQQASRCHIERVQPGRPPLAVDRRNRSRVEQIVDVEIRDGVAG